MFSGVRKNAKDVYPGCNYMNYMVHFQGPVWSIEGQWLVLDAMGAALVCFESIDLFVIV